MNAAFFHVLPLIHSLSTQGWQLIFSEWPASNPQMLRSLLDGPSGIQQGSMLTSPLFSFHLHAASHAVEGSLQVENIQFQGGPLNEVNVAVQRTLDCAAPVEFQTSKTVLVYLRRLRGFSRVFQ